MTSIITKTIFNIPYKTGPYKNALKFLNGAWMVSNRSNEELQSSITRDEKFANKRRIAGKSSTFSYLQAQGLYEIINSGQETIGSSARKAGVDRGTVERAIELYEDLGTQGFVLYGDE